MPEFASITTGYEPRPSRQLHTPWGGADHVENLGEGVIQVGTPSHGGIGVEKSLAAKRMSVEARSEAIQQDGWYWFEEDCDWALVAAEIPELFSERHRELAAESLKRWHPKYLAATGK